MSSKNKELVEKINKTFEEGNMEAFLAYCADDVRWNMIGSAPVVGKEKLRTAMQAMDGQPLPQIAVKHLISEGEMAVCEGTMEMIDENRAPYAAAFCDVYHIREGKVLELTSYLLESKKPATTEKTQ